MHSLPHLYLTASPWVLDLVTHLWQSTAVALAILLLVALGGRLSADTRRTLGWIALAKFVLPAAWLVKLVERASGGPKPWLASDAFMLPVNFTPIAPVAVTTASAMSGAQILAAVWVVGSVGLLACWITRAIRARQRIMEEAIPAPEVLMQRVGKAAACAGLRVVPRCAMVEPEYGAGLVGVSAPVLILPRGLAETLTSAGLDSILIHECLHLRRRDNLWNAVRAGFVGLLWFNPVAWLLNRAISIETEKSCDERVLEITGDADAYATSIVATVRHSLGIMRPGFSGATTPPVLGRVKAILAYPARRERPLARWAMLLAGIGFVALSGRAGSIAAEASTAAPTPSVKPVATAEGVPPSGAAQSPRYKVGTVTIKFAGAANVSEQTIRDKMQIREGGEFDEVILDRDIRALYRTGWFKFIEVKHERVDGTTFNLVVEVTPKPAVGAVNPRSPVTNEPGPAPVTPPSPEAVTVSPERVQWRNGEGELLARAKENQMDANARLEALRPEAVSVFVVPSQSRTEQNQKSFTRVLERIVAADKAAADAARGAADAAKSAEAASPAIPLQTPGADGVRPVVYEIHALDRVPGPRFQALPQYPFEMRRAGIGGEVVVDLVVDDKGDVVNAYAVRSTRVEFEASAVKAVSRWKFRPGRKGGQDVRTHMQVPVVFTLEG